MTFDKADARSLLEGERTWWAHHPTTRNVPNLLRNTVLAHRILRTYRPDVVVSAGAAVAVPFFLLAPFFGARTAYVEVYDRITLPTLTGRIVYPLADLFLLQWDEQQECYPDGRVFGQIW